MLLTLDSSLDKPLYAQIRDQIRERITTGALKVGERIDPSRELARRLGVHRTTVGNAYADLGAEGLIQGTVGRGTFVSPMASTLKNSGHLARRNSNDIFWSSFFSDEHRDDALGRLMANSLTSGMISFATAHGSTDLTPVELVRRATDAVLRREGAAILQYGSSDGYPPLKKYLQGHLRRDGIPAQLDEILITNGCQQSLDLLRRSLLSPGDTVVCENPTYTGLWQVFQSPGIRLIGVPVRAEGMDLDFLATVLDQSKVKLILASPNFQNPTGRTMPLGARKKLLEIAKRFQVPIVEDDIYGALRFRGRELPPLKVLDPAGLVIYLNSFSKVGFPGLRVGWIVASRPVIERVCWAKQSADLHTNMLGQAVLEEFGRRGWLDKLLRRARKVYEHKLGVMRVSMERYFPPEARCVFPEGGMSVWVELPAGLDAVELLVKARDRQVIFGPSRFFYFQQVQHNAFRLCFAGSPDDEIEKGIGILGVLLKTEIRRMKAGRNGRKAAQGGAGVAMV
ncbi:MAG TPA: PLP-dependent aminotransferase family protein [Terriglobia bacterium]|nr:PLP-dependent aminotransferase family protein [Terriglobia bacterium]